MPEAIHAQPAMRRRRRLAVLVTIAAALLLALPASAPAATSVYVANAGGTTLSEFDALAPSGLLAAKAGPSVASGAGPVAVAMSPNGKTLYAANRDAASLAQFDVVTAGALAAKKTATVGTDTMPAAIAVSPDGRNVYVTNFGSATVSQYDAAADGSLTAKAPASVPAGPNPAGIAVSPDGKSVYVALESGTSVLQYDVGSAGALTAKAAPAPAVPTGMDQVAVTPDGRNVYVTQIADATVATAAGSMVYEFDIGAGGALTPAASPMIAAGSSPSGIAISPDGRNAYVANLTGSNVSQYSVGAGGTLASKAAAIGAGLNPVFLTVSPNGRSLYVTDSGVGGGVVQFDIGADGALTPKAPATIATGSTPFGIVASPDQGPTASFAAGDAAAGAPTSFDASGSTDADGSVAQYAWDFGDGSAGAGVNPTHVYAAPGTYTVTLAVTDDAGCSSALQFTGQTASCVGTAAARTTRAINVVLATPAVSHPVAPPLLGRFTPSFATSAGRGSHKTRLGKLLAITQVTGVSVGSRVSVHCVRSCSRHYDVAHLHRSGKRTRFTAINLSVRRATIVEIRVTKAGHTGRLRRYSFKFTKVGLVAFGRGVGGCLTASTPAHPTPCPK